MADTTTSLAKNPVSKEAPACHVPNPKGASIGVSNPPIIAKKLSSMGKLAAVVAHEINNPLSGILSYSKLLIRSLENSPDQHQLHESVKNLKIIRDESKRCGDIVRNLLLFAKSSFGKRSLNHLQDIVNKSIQLIRHSIPART